MGQDVVADALNQMMNALRAGKDSFTVRHHSKMLISLLALGKLKGYIKDYKLENDSLTIHIGKLNGCNVIKPRYVTYFNDFEKYVARYLPAKDLGVIIVSTPQGLMTHQTAEQKKLGGSLIAYFY